jgi:hypothetical protein
MAEQDLLERAKQEIGERLEELYPLVEERDRLRAALEALEAGERKSRRRVGPAGSAAGPPRLAAPDAGSDGPSCSNSCRPSLVCGPHTPRKAWPSIPPRSIRLCAGWRSKERSSAGTARSIRAVS